MNKTVAIVGSHPRTREMVDYDRDIDVWVFNEALKEEWCKRADGVFQIHKPVIWRSETNRNDKNHYKWLKSGDTPVIFMQDKYDDVPQSERYPLEKIHEQWPRLRKYYTSSVGYAIALALYIGYEYIEVYGVEMETNTEYAHQRPGVAYWVGVADGLGVDLEFHGEMFHEPLYGYEGDVQIPLEYYQQRIDAMQVHVDGSKEAFGKTKAVIDERLQEFIKTFKADLSDLDALIMALGKNAHTFGVVDGALQVNQRYLEKCKKMIQESGDYLIVRQEFEGQMSAAGKKMQEDKRKLNYAAEVLDKARKALDTRDNRSRREKLVEKIKEAIDAYTKAVTVFSMNEGIIKENKLLMHEYDTYLQAAGITREGNDDEQS